ncbi:MAG: hypothetical protein JSS34_06145 [Proteobacteria bacterium]|nr:hypothetical protein [Pseudomonadota bacterium]
MKNPGKKLKNMVLNISSYLDICPHCATTLFHNSSLRETFIRDLTTKLNEKGVHVGGHIKLVNVISSNQEFMHSRSHKPVSEEAVHPNSFNKLPSWVLQITSADLKKLPRK